MFTVTSVPFQTGGTVVHSIIAWSQHPGCFSASCFTSSAAFAHLLHHLSHCVDNNWAGTNCLAQHLYSLQSSLSLSDMPLTFSLFCSNLRVVTEVARSLEFSDKVAELADRVIHGMTMAGKYEYNAVHLRIEKDARDWSQIMGGEEVKLLQGCFFACTSGVCVLGTSQSHAITLHCILQHEKVELSNVQLITNQFCSDKPSLLRAVYHEHPYQQLHTFADVFAETGSWKFSAEDLHVSNA